MEENSLRRAVKVNAADISSVGVFRIRLNQEANRGRVVRGAGPRPYLEVGVVEENLYSLPVQVHSHAHPRHQHEVELRIRNVLQVESSVEVIHLQVVERGILEGVARRVVDIQSVYGGKGCRGGDPGICSGG